MFSLLTTFSRSCSGCASQPKFQFSIRHYAGIVTYSSAGFVEKNKDQIHDEAADLVKLSSNRAMSQSYAFVEAAQRARSSASVCVTSKGAETTGTCFFYCDSNMCEKSWCCHKRGTQAILLA